jgi:flagellar capping protein FliD
MVLTVGTTAAQLAALGGTATGTVSLSQGLAGLLSGVGANGAAGGSVLGSKATLTDQIADLQKRVTSWDDILKQREDAMRTKFAAMQVALDKLNSMSSSFANLPTSSL